MVPGSRSEATRSPSPWFDGAPSHLSYAASDKREGESFHPKRCVSPDPHGSERPLFTTATLSQLRPPSPCSDYTDVQPVWKTPHLYYRLWAFKTGQRHRQATSRLLIVTRPDEKNFLRWTDGRVRMQQLSIGKRPGASRCRSGQRGGRKR